MGLTLAEFSMDTAVEILWNSCALTPLSVNTISKSPCNSAVPDKIKLPLSTLLAEENEAEGGITASTEEFTALPRES